MFKIHSPNTNLFNLSPELFAEICSFLPPSDLFTISQVCRKFRAYLFAPNSSATQQIWKESRLQFMPKEDMPPPEGMSEEKYVELLMTEWGCQICKQIKKCKIYWEFEVRCCEECFTEKTILHCDLFELNFPAQFVEVMPYTNFNHQRFCWAEQVDLAYSQYHDLSKESLQSWLDGKKHVLDSIMRYVEQRKSEELLLFPPFFMFTQRRERYECIVQFPRLRPVVYQNQVQIQRRRLEKELHELHQSNEPKGKTKKKNNKREFCNNYNNKYNVKGKNFKNRFTHKYETSKTASLFLL